MAKEETGPAIELGQVWQDRKKPQRKLEVLNVEPLRLKNTETGIVTENIAAGVLRARFKLIEKHIPQGGEAKSVAIERIGEAAPAADVTPIAVGQTYHHHDDIGDTVQILGPGDSPASWIVNDPKAETGRSMLLESEIRENWELLIHVPGPVTIEAQRTPEPADPPLTAAGVEPADAPALEDEEDPRPDARTANEEAILALMRGELRDISVQYKAKEIRIFCQCKRGAIITTDDGQDLLDQLAQELRLHWSHLSSSPKPGELPFKGVIKAPVEKPPESAAPAAPTNGSTPPPSAAAPAAPATTEAVPA